MSLVALFRGLVLPSFSMERLPTIIFFELVSDIRDFIGENKDCFILSKVRKIFFHCLCNDLNRSIKIV
jgi:hypothetical protein